MDSFFLYTTSFYRRGGNFQHFHTNSIQTVQSPANVHYSHKQSEQTPSCEVYDKDGARGKIMESLPSKGINLWGTGMGSRHLLNSLIKHQHLLRIHITVTLHRDTSTVLVTCISSLFNAFIDILVQRLHVQKWKTMCIFCSVFKMFLWLITFYCKKADRNLLGASSFPLYQTLDSLFSQHYILYMELSTAHVNGAIDGQLMLSVQLWRSICYN